MVSGTLHATGEKHESAQTVLLLVRMVSRHTLRRALLPSIAAEDATHMVVHVDGDVQTLEGASSPQIPELIETLGAVELERADTPAFAAADLERLRRIARHHIPVECDP